MVNLREARKEAQLTQRGLAELLHISQQTYSDYENGKTFPDMQTLLAIADRLNVSIDYLLGRTDDLGAVVMPSHSPELPADERELLDCYRKLLPEYKDSVLAMVRSLSGSASGDRAASKKQA